MIYDKKLQLHTGLSNSTKIYGVGGYFYRNQQKMSYDEHCPQPQNYTLEYYMILQDCCQQSKIASKIIFCNVTHRFFGHIRCKVTQNTSTYEKLSFKSCNYLPI